MTKYLLFFLLFLLTKVEAQQIIELKNPSFEDRFATDKMPKDWKSFGSEKESLPDIQPQQHGVKNAANEGVNYLSLLVRNNGTYQSIGQKLSEGDTLKANKNYKMSVFLAYSKHYKLKSSPKNSKTNYKKPAVFRVWGYNSTTNKEELLGETLPIESKNWKLFELILKPRLQDADTIILEAYYDEDAEKKYNGNLLIDNISNLIETKAQFKRRYK